MKKFIRTGEFNNDYSFSFKSLAQSLKKSSLFDKYQNELNSFSSNIYTTNDFINTVITTNYDDNYLPQPKWLVVYKTNSKLVFISSYEANHYLHDFNNDKCELVMLMPVVRQNQKRLFSLNSIKINEYLMQQLLIYSGSFYFNSIEEQEHFLRFICYVPTPRTQQQIEYFEDGRIEQNGFVSIENRKDVFGNDLIMIGQLNDKLDDTFQQDPSKFINEIISIRNFHLVPNLAHHLTIFNNGEKPLNNLN